MRVYRMAQVNIGIESLHEEVHGLCAAYQVAAAADFVVRTDQAAIDRERLFSAREDEQEGRAPRAWREEYLEELAVYRMIAERMPAYDTILFHGSAVAVDGQGYLFAARSGTGKSTHARLWQALLADRFAYVNDDKPLIRLESAGARVYGTPYDGKHHLSHNISVPLAGICLLSRGDKNEIEPLTAREAFPRLLGQTYLPEDRAALEKTLALLRQLTERVKLFSLRCNMDIEAARVAFEAMEGGNR